MAAATHTVNESSASRTTNHTETRSYADIVRILRDNGFGVTAFNDESLPFDEANGKPADYIGILSIGITGEMY